MWPKITPWLWVIVVAMAAELVADTVVNDENATKVIKESPVIIDTVVTHYENPTLEEYYRCVKIRDPCINKCEFMDTNCQNKCPTCPVLYSHDVLVQGINDTEYRPPVTTNGVNQTNVIKLKHEIHNIIDTKLGAITSNNKNLINVYQNKSSKTGGKFGLGYNSRGPCCHLIEPKRCKRSGRGFDCAPRRQLTCGSHCISRVMRAKRVVSCNEMNPEDCTSVREYIPEHRRPGCKYTSKYPFIDCGAAAYNTPSTSCSRCLTIPYMNVIRGQVPRDCFRCYGHSRINHRRQLYPLSYSSYQRPPYAYSMYSPFHNSYIFPPLNYNFDDFGDFSSVEDDDIINKEHNIENINNNENLTREDYSNDNTNEEIELNKEATIDDEHDEENGDDYYDDNDSN